MDFHKPAGEYPCHVITAIIIKQELKVHINRKKHHKCAVMMPLLIKWCTCVS